MTQFHRLLYLLGLFWLVSASAAEVITNSEFLVRSWQNEDGLPHSTINSILQTQDGYLWFGTYVGLVRFDGVRFVQYSSSNVPALETDQIVYLFEDRDNILWIAMQSGRLLAWKEGVVRVILPGDAVSRPVIFMAQQTNGVIWLQNEAGALGKISTNSVEFVFKPQHSMNRLNLGLVVDKNNNLWVGTDAGVKLWRSGKLVSPGLEPLNGKPMQALTRARDGAVWGYYHGQLWKMAAGKILDQMAAPEPASNVADMLEASDGRFWINYIEGTPFCRNPGGSNWMEMPKTEFRGLNRVLYEDHEQNIWRGGFGGGLTRIRPRIFTLHELAGGSVDKYARSVCSDAAGNVWAVLNDHTLSRINAGSPTPVAWSNFDIPDAVQTLFVDHRDSLWVGADNNRLWYQQNQSSVSKLNLGNDVRSVNALYEDSHDNIWVGFTGGTGVGWLPGGDPGRWKPLAGPAYPDVRAIVQTADGAMWFGTHYGGAFRWQNGKWTRWTMQNGLPSDYVRCFVADADDTLWMGTIHGLCRWRNGRCISITAEQGLWNDSISDIISDGHGNFWISSFDGIYRVRRDDLNDCADGRTKTVQCVSYGHEDGLINVECPGGFQPAGAKTPDGRLWFPTVAGVASVDPEHIRENNLPPPVWLESVTIDETLIPIQHDTTTLRVEPGKRRIDFRFTAPSFTSPEKVLFRHKLDDLDASWSPADAHRTVSYNHIPPGHYTFRIAACNNDGIWNMNGQTLKLNVEPFIWQTWWFKVMVGLVLAGGLAWGVRRRERWKAQLKFERLKREHAVEHERSRIAKDIHDDLGANLTQIVFLSQRVEGASHEPAEVKRWIRLIPTAASRAIQSLDEIVWAINPKHDPLESLANYLSRFAQEFLTLAGVRCHLDVPTVLPPILLSAAVRHNLLLTAREALQNAVTHAAAAEVRVLLQFDENGLKIIIADNGCGFDPGRTSPAGNGILNMQKRMEDIGGTLEIRSRPAAGTTVQCTLPANRLRKYETGN